MPTINRIKFEWEIIDDNDGITTHRARVRGGWLIRVTDPGMEHYPGSACMCFVQDGQHYWSIEK